MDNTSKSIENLINAVRKLRGPGGCNWDRSQTLQSLRPFMLEEAYEVADAVDRNDLVELRKELGDLLLHIIMSAEICREQGHFDMAEVASRITEKLVRRHPHVFDRTSSLSPEEVEKQWEAIKSAEKKGEKKQFFDSIPDAMPALQKAWRIQQRASEVGYPWPGESELKDSLITLLSQGNKLTDQEAGEVLFQLVCLMRQQGIEPERALRSSNSSFISRFNTLEELLESRGCTLIDTDDDTLKECIGIAFESN